jgi:hypothetical protein
MKINEVDEITSDEGFAEIVEKSKNKLWQDNEHKQW